MHTAFLCNRLCAIGRIMVMGLCVLWTELRWLAGPDRHFSSRLRLMKREHARLSGKIARMATLADPDRELLSADLSLLAEDIARLEADRTEAFRQVHQALRTRFARELAD